MRTYRSRKPAQARFCHATGVTPVELTLVSHDTYEIGNNADSRRAGHEFSGVIVTKGKDVDGFDVGDEIYGMNDWFADGASAEFCITLPQNIAASRRP